MAVEVFKLFGSIFVKNDEANQKISDTDKKAGKVANTLGKGISTAAKWGTAIVGGATAASAGIMKLASSTASSADEIDKMSQKLGLSKQGYQEWDYVLSQAGVEITSMSTGLKTLTNKLDDAKNGSSTATEMFKKLGLSTDNLKNMSREEVFSAVINGMQGMEDSTERAALANDLFGKSGQELTALFNESADSTEQLKQKAHELGLVMSDDTVNAGVSLTDTLDTMKRTIGAVVTKLSAGLMPIVEKVCNALINYMPQIQSFIDSFSPIIEQFFESVMPILMNLGEQVIPVIINLLSQIMPLIAELITTLAPIITDILAKLMPALIQIVESLLPPIMQIIEALLPLIQTIFDILTPFIDLIVTLIEPISLLISNAIAPLVTLIAELLNDLLQPLIPIFTDIAAIISSVLQPVFEALAPIFNLIGEALKPIFELLGKLLNAILPALTPLIELLANVFNSVLGSALKAVSGILESVVGVFRGVIDFVTGVFTGNWEQAWNGIIGIFKNIFNIIPSIVEFIINGAIGIINGLISGIDWAISWMGWEIPKIPEVSIPRFRAGIDYVPNDKYLAYLDAGEAVLTAQEAEKYRNAKRDNVSSVFNDSESEQTINNSYIVNISGVTISNDMDIDTLATKISYKLAAEQARKEAMYR